MGALALQFTILTAARSSETFDAVWPEFSPNRPPGRSRLAHEGDARASCTLVKQAQAVLEKANGERCEIPASRRPESPDGAKPPGGGSAARGATALSH
jgi:hypothetical protein